MVSWLFKKAPRTKVTCNYCNGPYGMARPNWPFCKRECKSKFDQAVYRPLESDGDLLDALKYP